MTAALIFVAALFAQQPAADPFQPVRFLVGSWNAKATGSGDDGSYSFDLELKDHVIVRHSSNQDHRDVLYIFSEEPNTPLKAIYFDSEGHVIHYTVTAPVAGPNTVVFLSDMYRLSYELKAGIMTGKFEIKPPGAADFKPYLEWTGAKR